jgi:hypothetical protein
MRAGILLAAVRLDLDKPNSGATGGMVVHEYATNEVVRHGRCISFVEGSSEAPAPQESSQASSAF